MTDADRVGYRIQEYKTVVENTSRLSDRRQIINDIFVGLNSLFLTALGFLFVNSHLKSWWTTAAFVLVTIFTLCINGTWLTMIERYRNLLGIRYSYLEAIEEQIGADAGMTELAVNIPTRKGAKPNIALNRFGIHKLEAQASHFAHTPKAYFSSVEKTLIYVFMFSYVGVTLLVAGMTVAVRYFGFHGPAF